MLLGSFNGGIVEIYREERTEKFDGKPKAAKAAAAAVA